VEIVCPSVLVWPPGLLDVMVPAAALMVQLKVMLVVLPPSLASTVTE
jgi:hypothetical protein